MASSLYDDPVFEEFEDSSWSNKMEDSNSVNFSVSIEPKNCENNFNDFLSPNVFDDLGCYCLHIDYYMSVLVLCAINNRQKIILKQLYIYIYIYIYK